MKRCKSPEAGLCSKPVAPAGVILTCEDHFPGGTCKAKCKNAGFDVVEAVSVNGCGEIGVSQDFTLTSQILQSRLSIYGLGSLFSFSRSFLGPYFLFQG